MHSNRKRNIHLIFTIHSDNRNCNSYRLLQIIKGCDPELIFEELEEEIYQKTYVDNKLTTLETDAIIEYLKIKDVKHIPVDTLKWPLNFHDYIGKMRSAVAGQATKDSFHYRNLVDHLETAKGTHGFDLLNSHFIDKLLNEIDHLKEEILLYINDKDLHRNSELEKEINSKREDVILENIYNYSKKHDYQTALLFIGAGHRKSLLSKIKGNRLNKVLNIKWTLLNKTPEFNAL